MRIIFVCTGNICRSPMAHHYLEKRLDKRDLGKQIIVESAGTHAYTGSKATEYAIKVMKKYDVDMTRHRATKIENIDINNVDYVFCMTENHKKYLENLYPQLKDKTFTLKEFIGEKENIDIQDPWGCDENTYEKTAKEIVEIVDEQINKILEG
ncbi:MAG: low molecular weight protein arginine phosphatase [Clostridia bacterium]|nr:low molecular weight protein arginine phosphatase [Clostridia bacterium]